MPNGVTGSSTTNNIIVNYSATATNGNISIKAHNTCGNSNAITLSITVKPSPATPVITQNGNNLVSNASVGNQWYNLGSGLINNATSNIYSPQISGKYFTIVSSNGCSSDSSNIIYYNNLSVLEANYNKTIRLYPNPVKDNLTIESPTNANQKLEIINLLGQTMYTYYIYSKATIDVSSFPKGVYLIKINTPNGVVVKKFVKE